MKSKIKVLAVVPYEGLKSLMEQVALHRDDIELTAIYADLEHCAEIAALMESDYDVIISRANAANLINEVVTRPVIDIGISHFDVLSCIRQAQLQNTTFAIMGFPDLMQTAHSLCELLQYDIETIPIQVSEDLNVPLSKALQKGCTTIICDMVPYEQAKALGISPILLTSGPESVHSAFDAACKIFAKSEKILEKLTLLEQISNISDGLTIVCQPDRELIFISEKTPSAQAAYQALKNADFWQESDSHSDQFFLKANKTMYAVSCRSFNYYEKLWLIFHFTPTNIPVSHSKYGLTVLNNRQVGSTSFQDLYGNSSTTEKLQHILTIMGETDAPIMIHGEPGTGKDIAARLLYASGRRRGNPLYIIDCSLINDKTWNFLTASYNSPFSDNDNTIFFSNLSSLEDKKQKQLLSLLLDTKLHIRNRLILSCCCEYGTPAPHTAIRFANALNCFTLNLPPLRDMKSSIPNFANFYLNRLNKEMGKQTVGFQPEALQLLQDFQWSYNSTQFRRVLREILTLNSTSYIPESVVGMVLENECCFDPPFANTKNHATGHSLDLSKSLNEINKDIILQVLLETNHNQSAAAERLGISRTTLWRYLKS